MSDTTPGAAPEQQPYQPEQQQQPYQPYPQPAAPRKRRAWIVVVAVVAAVVVALGSWGVVQWAVGSAVGASKQQTIERAVVQIREQAELPKQVDEATTWTAVEAEPSAIHYVYTLSSQVDPSAVTEQRVRELIQPTLCKTKQTRDLLDKDIAMRYTYSFESAPGKIDVTFTKADC